nr:AMP-binding protein [Bacillus subtilis]
MFAALEIGAVVVPVSWQLKPYEMTGILKASEPKAMFYGAEFKETLDEVLPELSSLCVTMETGTAYETSAEFEALFAGPDHLPETEMVSPDDTALLMFTSGTTGNPKRCMVTHGGIYRYVKKSNSSIARMKVPSFSRVPSDLSYECAHLHHAWNVCRNNLCVYKGSRSCSHAEGH